MSPARGRRRAPAAAALLGAWALLGWATLAQPGAAAAQGRGDARSHALLRAATLESQGDLDGAEAALRDMLVMDPGWSGALFALERVLRAKGEEAELRPLVEGFLARTSDPRVHALRLELIAEGGALDSLRSETERWLTGERDPAAWALAAEVHARALGPDEGLALLRRGRSTLGGDALALELADALAASGDLDAAAAEWAAVASAAPAGADSVAARIRALGERAPEAGERAVEALARDDTPEGHAAALSLALALGLDRAAIDLASDEAEALDARARAEHLADVARLAEERGRGAVARWAYEQVGASSATTDEQREADRALVELALASGDTARALEAQRRLVASLPPGSDQARRAEAELVRLQAVAEPGEVERAWTSFRSAYPGAPELDAVAAAVAGAFRSRGETERAAAALQGVEGPRSQVERAFLLLEQGDVEGGRALLLEAVGALPPGEATPLIQLAGLLGRVRGPGLDALVRAEVAAYRGRGAEAAAELAETASGAEAPMLLAEAARLADRGQAADVAVEIRRRLVTEHPDAPEVGEATLALARHLAGPGGAPDEAARLLEDLITRMPDAAVVPEARLELERLRSGR